MVKAHPPVVPQQGKGKQGGGDAQPEQEVQQEGQPGQLQTPAQSAHPVVDQAQGRPQQESQPENRRLVRHVHIHTQRSRREKKPPRPAPSSS